MSNWVRALSVSWEVALVIRTPEVGLWHALAALPLLTIAQLERAREHATRAAFLLVAVECVAVFSSPVLPGDLATEIIFHRS